MVMMRKVISRSPSYRAIGSLPDTQKHRESAHPHPQYICVRGFYLSQLRPLIDTVTSCEPLPRYMERVWRSVSRVPQVFSSVGSTDPVCEANSSLVSRRHFARFQRAEKQL